MPKPTALPFSGTKLAAIRARKGLTNRQVSQRCAELGHPIHHSTLGKIERGIQRPLPGLPPVLAEVLAVDLDDLLDEDHARKVA